VPVGTRPFGLAAALAVLAAPVAAWWLIGDQSESRVAPRNRDYVARAPHVPSWIVATAGAVALLVLVAAAAVLLQAVRHRRIARGWIGVVGLLSFAGVLVALFGRIATAGVDGANIGAGLAMIVGGPVLIVVVASAIGLGVSIHRAHVSAP
jgi:hypothetical protein